MEVVAECGKPVILCLMAGSDIDLSYAREHFDVILVLWYPGGEGGRAAAKVLFGEAAPTGKLPVTFYESLEELPDFEDYTMEWPPSLHERQSPVSLRLWPDLRSSGAYRC